MKTAQDRVNDVLRAARYYVRSQRATLSTSTTGHIEILNARRQFGSSLLQVSVDAMDMGSHMPEALVQEHDTALDELFGKAEQIEREFPL